MCHRRSLYSRRAWHFVFLKKHSQVTSCRKKNPSPCACTVPSGHCSAGPAVATNLLARRVKRKGDDDGGAKPAKKTVSGDKKPAVLDKKPASADGKKDSSAWKKPGAGAAEKKKASVPQNHKEQLALKNERRRFENPTKFTLIQEAKGVFRFFLSLSLLFPANGLTRRPCRPQRCGKKRGPRRLRRPTGRRS